MKTLIGLGALVTSSSLFASSANAGWFSRCHCPCQPAPSCPSAATASKDGTTSYARAYQAAEPSAAFPARAGMPSPSLERGEYMCQYQEYRCGW